MSVTSQAVESASRVLASLPAQFLVLVLMNLGFISGLLWFLNNVDTRRVAFEQAETEGRGRLLTPILTACMNEIPAAELQKLLQQRP